MKQIQPEPGKLISVSAEQRISVISGRVQLYLRTENRLFSVGERSEGAVMYGCTAPWEGTELVYRAGNETRVEVEEAWCGGGEDAEITSRYHDIQRGLSEEAEYYSARKELARENSAEALKELASVISGDRSRQHTASADEDPLIWACRELFAELGIGYQPVDREILENSPEPLKDILHGSKVQSRKVVLEGSWWQEDCGPLFIYTGSGNPAALIPVKGNRYEMRQKGAEPKLVDRELANSLEQYGYMFYRSLPLRKLNLNDLIQFVRLSIPRSDTVRMLIIGILTGVLGVSTPVVSGILFNTVIPESHRSQLFQLTLLLLTIGSVLLLFELTKAFTILRIESKIDVSLQSAMWDRLITLPTSFFRRFSIGEMVMRTMGINTIRQMISGAAFNTILTALFSLFSLALLFVYSVKIALIALLLTAVSVSVTLIAGFIQLRQESELVEITNRISGLVLQIITGLSKIRTSGNEDKAFLQWTDAFTEQSRIFIRKQRIENMLIAFNGMFTIFSMTVIFFAAFRAEGLSMGNFIAFYTAFVNFQTGFMELSRVVITINAIIPTYNNIKPILESVPEYDAHRRDPGVLDGAIDLNHVTFRYHPDYPPVIDDLSLTIKPGEYVALVGGSGSGKSTIMRLLLGFEEPEMGRIYYSEKDLETVDIRSIRKQLGVVLQNGKLLSGDIFTNIIGTSPTLTLDDAWAASAKAGIKDDIEQMPMKMHTFISEGSTTISGGQKQRILIARAIVKKPKILFLDEATSALDNRTQTIVTKSLNELNSTRIVIAHRLSTVMACDRIVVIHKGRISEQGTYDELMKNQGEFYELAKRQLA